MEAVWRNGEAVRRRADRYAGQIHRQPARDRDRTERGSVELPITGPSSPRNQVELSPALAQQLGVDAKVELSGSGTAGGVTLVGPEGTAELEAGVLIPQPHIHMPPEDASTLSLLEGQIITLATADGRQLDNVVVRVSHLCANRIHLLAGEDCPFRADDTFHIV